MRAAQAMAAVNGRDYVLPQDVASVFYDVIAHRLVFSPQAGRTAADRADLLRVLVMVIAPLTAAAAFIESYITPVIASFFM